MIKQLTLAMVLGGLMWVLVPSTSIMAQTDTDETRLEKVQQSIDQDTSAKGQETQVQTLAKEFKVAPSVVEGLRASKQGWGEITIELAMAQRLALSDPKTYPTLTDALTKIGALRAEKTGWGKIAISLGFKLGPVISSAERASHNLATASRVEKSPGALKPDKAENASRAERSDRPGFAGRPERPARVERVR